MKQAAFRWIRRLLVLGAFAGVLAAVLHSPWARGLVLRELMSQLSTRTGLVFAADTLSFNLFSLTATVDGLQISRPASASAPILTVRQARIALSHRLWAGTIEAHYIEADGVALVLDLAPSPDAPGGEAEPFRVPVFIVGRALLRHASIEVLDPGGLGHLKALDVTLELEGNGPRRMEGAITVAGGLTLDNEDTRARVDRIEGRAFLDGDTIGVEPVSAVVGAQRLALDGSIVFTGPSPRFDLGIAGSVDVAQIVSWFPALPAGDGPLELTGRVTGPLTDPQFRYSARTTGVTLPDIRLPPSTAEGYISRAGIYVERMRTGLGQGRIEASGRLPLGRDDPDSRFSLTWNNVAVASLARVFPLLPADPIGMVSTGSARVHWPGAALEFATVSGEVSSDVRFAPALQAARVRMTGTAGNWALQGEQALEGGTLAAADAAITISPADVTNSQVLGTLRVTSANLKPAIEEASRAFAGLPDASAWLGDSPFTIEASIAGTLGEPRLTGTASSDTLRLAGLPVLGASATFDADAKRLVVSNVSGDDGSGNRVSGSAGIAFEAGTTAGSFSAQLENLDAILTALARRAGSAAADDLEAGGSVALAGTWDGPMTDPAVSMTVTGTAISVTSPAIRVERGTVEGRLEGSLSAPRATMRVSADAVRSGSLAPVPADAVLSLDAGRVDVNARVPDWGASLNGQVSTVAPREFSATVAVDDLTGARLVALLGAQDPEWTVDGAIAATLDASGSLDSRTLRVGGQASLAGGGLRAGGSRVIDGIDAALEIRDGRLWLSRMAALGFGGPLSASGDLPLNWIEAYLPDGWRVDDTPVSPKPAAFDMRAEPDVEALSAWLRPDEPAGTTGSLRLRVSATALAASLDAVEGRVVVEPGTIRVRDVAFTLPRAAEIRITDGRASVDDLTVTAPGTTATLSGTLGLQGAKALDARMSASGALGFLSSIVPGRMAGTFNASIRAAGTVADPQMSGTLALDGAAWVWPEQRMAFRDWSGGAVLSAGSLTMGTLTGLVNGGEASVSGALQLGGRGGTSLSLRVRDAFAEVVKGFRSQADVDLTLASAGDGALISGTITVTSGAYREPITAMARLFSSTSAKEAPAGETSLLGAIELDVNLTASSPIIIENSAGRLDLVPDLKLRGSLAEPVLFGSLDMLDDGRLTLMGRTFRLTEARVVFPGAGDPAVQLIGETRVGDYAVTLRTQGPVTSMEATYTSDPPLSQRDLQSLLITGRTSDATSTRGRDDEQFVLGTASSDLLGLAGQMVGLDSVQLGRGDFELGSSDVNPAMRLTVSKRINGRTRLILSQDLDNNKLTWIVAITPRRGYEIRLSQRDNLEEVVEFRQEISFGPGVSPPTTSGVRKRSRGPRVSLVEFTGAPGYTAAELLSVVKLKPSKTFDAGTWQEDRARLEAFYRDRGHATARIVPERIVMKGPSAEHIQLKYRVDPGPRTLLDVGGIDVSDDDRRALMRVWSLSVLPEFLQEDLTLHLRDLMAERGHLRPSIAVTLDTSRPDVVSASVTVTPGPVTRVRKLVLEGVGALPEPELRAALSEGSALESSWVDPALLVEAVEDIYEVRGYPSARVVADDLAFDGDVAERRLRVTEGPQEVLKDVVMTGVAEARAADATAAVALTRGQPLLPGTEADARKRLERFYLDRGFRSASVRSSRAKADPDGRTALSFAVTEGPLSIVNAITVKGLDATHPAVADTAITLEAGDPAGQQGVSETQKRLYGLGVFRSAEVTFEPAPKPQAADTASMPVNMVVSLEEARRYQLRYGVQLSNEYGPVFEDFTSAIGVAADVRDRNFLGRAFTLGASTRLERNLQSLRGQFSLPVLFNQKLQTSLYATVRSETDTSEASIEITDKERDVTFEQRLRLPYRMEVSWGYSYNVRDVTLVDQPRADSLGLKGALGTLNGTFIFDTRDKPFDASRGWFQSSNLQWGLQSLGSDFDYVRVLLRQFYYQPAGPFVFASGVRWGWLHGIEGDPPITIFDRFFDAGGSQTVRGYAEDSLSAVEFAGFPVGGTKLLILNQEARFPLFSRWLQGAVFIDAGNTFRPNDPLKLSELAVGAGFGIRIMTPFAPIRIDVGYPLDRRPGDSPYRVHFSIGQIF